MSADDKAQNTGEKLAGKAEEAFWKLTGDDSKVAEGEAKQAGASAKQAGENVKDVFKK